MADTSYPIFWSRTSDDGTIEGIVRQERDLTKSAWYFWGEKRWVDDDGHAADLVASGEVDDIITEAQADAAIAAGPRKVAA